MPVKFLPHLRLLNTCEAMRLGPSIHSSRAVPVFSRIFPFRLRYLSSVSQIQGMYVRKFSSRSTRAIAGPGSGFGRESGKVQASKSLIEDESELSDWVSELRTSSLRGRLTSDEDEAEERGRSRFKDKGSFSLKRQRKSDGDDIGESTRRRNRNSDDPYGRNPRFNRRFDRDFGDDKEEGNNEFQSKRRNGGFKGREVNSAFGSRTAERLNRSGRNFRKSLPLMTEDDLEVEDDKGEEFVGGIGNLLEEEDSDSGSDGYDDGADEILSKTRNSMFGSDKGSNEKNVSRSSPEKSDSYLSETRFA